LDIRQDMLAILKRKYFPRKLSEEGVTIDEHLREHDLSAEIQQLVKSCLKSSGRSEKTTLIKTYVENNEFEDRQQAKMENESLAENSQLQADTKQIQALLVGETARSENVEDKSSQIHDYVNGLVSEDNLSEQQILELFGIDENGFRNTLRPVIKNILELFYYLKTGELLIKEKDFEKLNQVLESESKFRLNIENINFAIIIIT
jgi:hypothetical protein